MNTQDLIKQVQADGLALSFKQPDHLHVIGQPEAITRWTPALKKAKSQVMALLSAELAATIRALPAPSLHPAFEQRVKAMAIRWRYDLDETREVLALAATDPHGWMLAVALDERREQEFMASVVLPRFES